MSKSRVQAVAVNTIIGIVQKIITVVANLLIQIIFVHTLGEQYIGISALFTSILAVLSFAELGIGTAIIYNLYKPIAEKDYDKIQAYLHSYATAYRIVTIVIIGAGIVCCPLLPYVVKDVPNISENITLIFLLFVADTAVSYLYAYKATFLNANQNNYIASAVHSVMITIKTIAVAIFLILWSNYYAYLIFSIMITLLQNIIISIIANKKYPFLKEKSKARLNKEEKNKIYKNVYAMSLYKVSGTVLNSSDNIIISNMSNTSQVGLLSNQVLIIRQVYDVTSQFFSAVTTSIGNLSTEENVEYEYKILNTIRFISFWLFMFCSIAIIIISNPFIELIFGAKYVCAYPIIIALVADFYIKGMINPISSFRTSHGLFVQGKYRPLIMALLNIVLSVIMMKWVGIVGVFIATVLSRLLTQVWFDPYVVYKYVFKRSPMQYFGKSVLWLLFTCGVGYITYFIASLILVKSLILSILLRTILCLVIPNALLILCFHKTEEFQKTKMIILQIIKKIGGLFKRRTGRNAK